MEILTVDDVVQKAASLLVGQLRANTTTGRSASIALSGGRTPWAVLARLAQTDLPWERVHVYQVDERIVPLGEPTRNLTHLDATLLSRVPAIGHPLPVDEPDLDAAAQRYAAELPHVLDIVHLGLGPDGHTASLVPADPALEITDRDVAITNSYLGTRRMTLTYPPLDRAASILWIVTGNDKREALRRLVAGDPAIPAGRVARARAVVLTDIVP
ncbi:MAG: 6-phosphogluconolactonase [Thermoleophilia bacterium]|nr:6-phosphogluconolactonase [Thermoleophilia bacterium]